jgi:hypothetical protein
MNLSSLDTLGKEERRLYDALPVHHGAKDVGAESRIRDEYRHVIDQYLVLAKDGNVEAVKRLVFLWWYSNTEPGHLTGVPEFTTAQAESTAELLRVALKVGIDDEFKRMLAWYYCITAWHFDDGVPELTPALKTLTVRAKDKAGIITLDVIDTSERRGQLAEYFGSMKRPV